jgi:hypothetical protein
LGCLESKAVRGLSLGSQQLRELPKFPGNLPVKAIAGNVTERNVLLFGLVPRPTGSDLVVSVKSATDEYTVNFAGDGREVVSCEGVVVVANVSPAPCQHSALPDNPEVQELVKNGIRDYLAATPLPSGTPYTFFNEMTLRLPPGLNVQVQHGEGPSSYQVGCSDPTACLQFTVYSPAEVGGDLHWRDWGLPECAAAVDKGDTSLSVPGKLVDKGVRQIGGKPAKYYEATLCGPGTPQETARFWEAKDGSVLIMTTDSEGKWWDKMDSLLAAATWK